MLTQATDCIKNIEDEDCFLAVITNPVTSSQYVQWNSKEENENVEAITFDDTFDDLDVEQLMQEEKKAKEKHNKLTSELVNQNTKAPDELPGTKNSSITSAPPSHAVNKSVFTMTLSQRAAIRRKFLPVSSGIYKELGTFFGLTRHHRKFILETKKIEDLYDWQTECLNLPAIHCRGNLVYALPTSGGKTLVAEIAMMREVLLRSHNVIFVLPYVSIVQEKIQDLMPFATEFGFHLEDYCAGKGAIPPVKRRKKSSIYVCTIEKSQILFDSLHKANRLDEIGLIVVDELHMVGDQNRGYSLETLLTKAVYNQDVRIQVIGMSATISNLKEIAKFLKADVYTRNFRPVELKEFVKIGNEIRSIDTKATSVANAFQVERKVGDNYSPGKLKRDPDHIAALVLQVVPKLSCLIFCATKQNCESVAILLAEILPREFKDVKKDEKENLMESIRADSNGRICPILAKTIPFGIAYHHSGLTSDERKHLEEAYRLNIICVICCTSTLAAGVNLPAARVIIRSPYVGPHFLSLTRYKQMVGRAGRAGKSDIGESYLICDPRDDQKLVNLLCSKMDETVSGFVQENDGALLRAVILNLIGVKFATTIDDLVRFFKSSLLHIQITRTLMTLKNKIINEVIVLMNEGAVIHVHNVESRCNAAFKIAINGTDQEVFNDDILEVSQLGKAAVNAGVTLEMAKKIEQDLMKVELHLVTKNVLHLLYAVTPEEIVVGIKPDYKNYNKVIMKLDETSLFIAKVIGISESLGMRMVTKPGSIKPQEEEILKRFYVTLMLYELWDQKDVQDVASRYKVNRGIVHGLSNSAASRAYCIFKFCETFEKFSFLKLIFEDLSKRIFYNCSTELLPLMELPAVKIVS